MTPTARDSSRPAASMWRLARGTATGLMLLCGGSIALMSLGVREHLSGYLWSSDRYWGSWGWQLADGAMAFTIGSVTLPRLAWLVVTALARSAGYNLPGGGLRTWDFWALGLGGAVLVYLVFVANVRDAPFWPVALPLIGVFFFLRQTQR